MYFWVLPCPRILSATNSCHSRHMCARTRLLQAFILRSDSLYSTFIYLLVGYPLPILQNVVQLLSRAEMFGKGFISFLELDWTRNMGNSKSQSPSRKDAASEYGYEGEPSLKEREGVARNTHCLFNECFCSASRLLTYTWVEYKWIPTTLFILTSTHIWVRKIT